MATKGFIKMTTVPFHQNYHPGTSPKSLFQPETPPPPKALFFYWEPEDCLPDQGKERKGKRTVLSRVLRLKISSLTNASQLRVACPAQGFPTSWEKLVLALCCLTRQLCERLIILVVEQEPALIPWVAEPGAYPGFSPWRGMGYHGRTQGGNYKAT